MKPKKNLFKIILNIFVVIILLVIVSGVLGYLWYNKNISKAVSNKTEMVVINIESGTSSQEVGELLKENGLINNILVWQIYVKLNKPVILADKYDIPLNLSLKQIVEVLKVGQKDVEVSVTIPEGLRFDEVESILDEKLTDFTNGSFSKTEFDELVTSPDSFLSESEVGQYILNIKPVGNSLEGFLFPDTYSFAKDADTKFVLTTLLANFKKKTEGLVINNGLSFYENLTLASIVERESSEDNFQGVAGVFLTRLEIGEKLGSDITVLYILKRWKPEPTYYELLIDSPFNTRLNYGFPPTPVGNPGLKVVSDTATALPGNDLFFIADEAGNMYYGETMADHEYNICRYITMECL
jgi:UPF0755 protein